MRDGGEEERAIRRLMSFRLSVRDEGEARLEWLDIVDGMHS
jgi:hypothetical protein